LFVAIRVGQKESFTAEHPEITEGTGKGGGESDIKAGNRQFRE